MNDTIYRQAAIDAILHNQEVYSNNFGNDPIDKYTIAIIDNDAQTIAQLPSAQSERPKGKWIIQDNPGTGWYRITCSECGEDVTSTVPTIGFMPKCKVLWDYCPDCGSYNRGEQDE